MPYVDFVSHDDYVSLWYITNSPYRNLGSFDPRKPTVIILPPWCLDSSWLSEQLGDPRLDSDYNLIAFDMRVSGKSSARPTGRHDCWVEAADLAFAHQALHLPPAHILAHEGLACNIAMRFAALFPDMCLSLTLVNVPPPTELRLTFHAFDELLKEWCYATDLDTFEHSQMEAVKFIVGPECDEDLQDALICYWSMNLPPFRRQRLVELVNVLLNRSPLNAKTYGNITQPVLIVQAERSETCPVVYAERLAADLVNAKDGAIQFTVKGAMGCLCVVPSTASIVNQVFVKFLSRLPPARSDILPPQVATKERMSEALKTLSELMSDPDIATRDPMSSLSFSCLSPEVIKSQKDAVDFYGKDEWKALSPLGPDGRPIRKYSERKEGHWFQSSQDGNSYAGLNQPQSKGQLDSEHKATLPISEPISADAAEDGRLRRTEFSPTTVEKLVIKGSMSKVVAPTTLPFQRLLLSGST